eukprot:gb/GECH01012179.1/.p1 GENE.gb/GECH01012179.1/~~gb/GECH01012179.1/.p1  ORF type:complete len:383 (+),score=89.15 gb/GECH01012179.1/:1-1149(+)
MLSMPNNRAYFMENNSMNYDQLSSSNTEFSSPSPFSNENNENESPEPEDEAMQEVPDTCPSELNDIQSSPSFSNTQSPQPAQTNSSTNNEEEFQELECTLCLRPFYEPITLPCGHSFDRSCLERALDHGQEQCPLCREPMHIRPLSDYPVSVSLRDIVQRLLPEQYKERHEEENAKENNTSEPEPKESTIPIFVLDTVLFPRANLPLHVFEPRYRLMVRRCLRGSKRFGVAPSSGQYGTEAFIEDHHELPDGRSLLNTVGKRRFRILERSERDGYAVAKVQWIEDSVVSDDPELPQLCHQAHNMATAFLGQLGERASEVERQVGSLPNLEQPVELSFWLCSVLPLPNYMKQELLGVTDTKHRLQEILGLMSSPQSSDQCCIC